MNPRFWQPKNWSNKQIGPLRGLYEDPVIVNDEYGHIDIFSEKNWSINGTWSIIIIDESIT